jgi:predicted membrane channel-forming protein YqfA (hemolysin III family)
MLKGIIYTVLLSIATLKFVIEILYTKPSFRRFRKIGFTICTFLLLISVIFFYLFSIEPTWIFLLAILLGITWYQVSENFYNKYIKEKDKIYREKSTKLSD